MGTLYLVATPIGNLEDISARALRTLREVKLIAAEDTRHTRKLLTHFDIHTPLTSYYEHNRYTKLDTVLAALQSGDIALVSDAGTPALNDPGYELVRAAISQGHSIIPIPGACAPVAALVASGLPSDGFLYLGYLPRKSSERRKMLEPLTSLPYTLIFLETPHRLVDALSDLAGVLGNRPAAVARELTKLHEEMVRGSLQDALTHFQTHEPRGEFTLVIGGALVQEIQWDEKHLLAEIDKALQNGESPSHAAVRLSTESGWQKRAVYSLINNGWNNQSNKEK